VIQFILRDGVFFVHDVKLRSALGGARIGRSAAKIGARIGLAAVLPRRLLDPFDATDPLPTLAAFSSFMRAAERVGRASPVLS
jgi:hypothetical protein